MKLGHISDLHILELDSPRPWEFLNKRLVGSANLLLKRSKSHSTDLVHQAIAHLDALDVDHIAISGDLTNLALDSEFAAAARVIGTIDNALERVSVVPGNHDYYTRGAADEGRFERHMAPYLKSDLPVYQLGTGYPFCKLRDDVAIIGLNSGIATPWLFATGRVDKDELNAVARLLDDPRVRDLFKVVIIHHPVLPVEYHKIEFNRRLINAREVLDKLRVHDVDLVIHGHTHRFSIQKVPHLRGSGTTYVCEAGSTSVQIEGDAHLSGKFNIYHIENRRLARVETHLFESHQAGFVPWREEIFETPIEA